MPISLLCSTSTLASTRWTRPHIELCLSLFDWALFRSTKAAVKLHALLDLRGSIPTFIHISDGKLHDVNVLDILPVEAGAFYVMDRGYLDFARLYAMQQAGAIFVPRAKRGTDARRLYSAPAQRAAGVICDQRVMLNGFYAPEAIWIICGSSSLKTRSRARHSCL